MNVTEAVQRRKSVRAFRSDPVPGKLLREILEIAARAPSGCNVQPWRVHALSGTPLAELKDRALRKFAATEEYLGKPEPQEYDIFPSNLWEPYRTHRFVCGEDLYATMGIAREDKAGRMRHLAKNLEFFGAPVGLFFSLDRQLLSPQWADLGMYMQTVMLLAVERGLDTCAQEFWALLPKMVSAFVNLPPSLLLFSGMAMGYRDETASVNSLCTRRDPVDAFAVMRGFAED